MKATTKRGLAAAIGLTLAASVLAVMVIGPAAAQGEEEAVRLPFGPVGIARGQTAVLNVVFWPFSRARAGRRSASTTRPARCSGRARSRPRPKSP